MTEYGSSPNCVFSASSRRTSENTPSRHFGEKAGAGRVVSIYEYPRSLLLGNPAYLTREEGCWAPAKARREEGSTTSTMMSTATTSPTAITTLRAAPGAMSTPGAPDIARVEDKSWWFCGPGKQEHVRPGEVKEAQ